MPTTILILVISIFSCKKNDLSTTSPTMNLAKASGIQRGEPILVSVANTVATDSVKWVVTPSQNVVIRNLGNSASIMFGQSGAYNITASNAGKSTSNMVSVTSTNYTTPQSPIIQPFSNDKISIIPSIIGDHDSAVIALTASTLNSYNCLNNILVGTFDYAQSTGSFKITYTGVIQPSDCQAGAVKASGMQFLYPLKDGANPFSVVFNGNTYSGSILRTGNTFTFTWPYSDGVTISPLTITK